MAGLININSAGSGIRNLFKGAEINDERLVDTATLRELPKPARKYFSYCLAKDQHYLHTLRLKYRGSFKTAPDKAWMDIKGQQYFRAQPPGFYWIGKTSLFTAHDSYLEHHGRLSVYLLGVLRIVNKKGINIDQAELLRWLGESVWMPTNLLPDENISWSPVDDTSAKLSMEYFSNSVSYIVYFNVDGQITGLETERYMGNELTKWAGELGEYEQIDGMMVPTNIKASWILDKGKYTYADFHVSEFEYNNPNKY